MAGFGNRADIYKVADSVGAEKREELFDGVGGVADGEKDVWRHYSSVMRGK